MLVALFGITNEGLNLFVNLVVLFLVVVWIALIAWTYLDARRRIQDPVLVACATGRLAVPLRGHVVYAILRPPEFLEDAHERELEIRAAELRVRQLEEQSCPNCGYPIERTYLRCPNCRARVKDPCESCQKPIDPRWTICPYCETPQRRAAPPAAPRAEAAATRAARPSAPAKRGRAPEARRRDRRPGVTPAQQGRAAQAASRPVARLRRRAPGRRAAKPRKPASGRSRVAASPPSPARRPGEERPTARPPPPEPPRAHR